MWKGPEGSCSGGFFGRSSHRKVLGLILLSLGLLGAWSLWPDDELDVEVAFDTLSHSALKTPRCGPRPSPSALGSDVGQWGRLCDAKGSPTCRQSKPSETWH